MLYIQRKDQLQTKLVQLTSHIILHDDDDTKKIDTFLFWGQSI